MEEHNPTELNLSLPESFLFTEDEFNNMHISDQQPRQVSSTSTAVARRSSIYPVRVRTLRNRRNSHRGVRQRKVDSMSKRIHELEAEIKILKSKNFCDKCRSRVGLECEPKSNVCHQQQQLFAEKEPVKPIDPREFCSEPMNR